jgi:BASS family bile acid:Na+ symporter
LIGAYVLAAVLPQFGMWLRGVSFGSLQIPGAAPLKITLSLCMLAFLLFNAGLGIKVQELRGLVKRPLPLGAGLIANIAVPIALILAVHGLMRLWHNNDEVQNLLVGLALIIAMPIAGSSATWSQNANGNLSLSLGLVFFSTLLSPFTTPFVLRVFGGITIGDYSEDLQEMAHEGTDLFLLVTVVLPSLIGMAVHFVLGEQRVARLKPTLKLINFVFLLLLNYSNASSALPQVLRNTDWDFLALIYGTTLVVCAAAFIAGWLIATLLRSDAAERAALIFGLGMNNNGTGLVLAATALSDHPNVLLPMIFYTLVQQVLAGLVDWKFFRPGIKEA